MVMNPHVIYGVVLLGTGLFGMGITCMIMQGSILAVTSMGNPVDYWSVLPGGRNIALCTFSWGLGWGKILILQLVMEHTLIS